MSFILAIKLSSKKSIKLILLNNEFRRCSNVLGNVSFFKNKMIREIIIQKQD